MAVGGSFNPWTIHVKFTVEPVSMYISGVPKIVVVGSVQTREMDYPLNKQEIYYRHHVIERHI